MMSALGAVILIAWDSLKAAPESVLNSSMRIDTNGANNSVAVRVINKLSTTTMYFSYTQERYEKGLRERKSVLLRERQVYLERVHNQTETQVKKRTAVERELAVIDDKLGNLEST